MLERGKLPLNKLPDILEMGQRNLVNGALDNLSSS